MNCILISHTGYIYSFYLLEKALSRIIHLDRVGYYVSGRRVFKEFLQRVTPDWLNSRCVLNEWDILDKAYCFDNQFSYSLEDMEKEFGDPIFWNVLICDRRIFYGRKAVFTQDYKPRFYHNQMLKILRVGFHEIRRHVEIVKPDFIVSFINVTFGEYLYYLIAKRYNIPFLNIRNTKIENYVICAPDIFEPATNVKKRYLNFEKNKIPKEIRDFSKSYITSLKTKRVTYEGQNYINNSVLMANVNIIGIGKSIKSTITWLIDRIKHPVENKDNQMPNIMLLSWYNEVIKPFRYKRVRKYFQKNFVTLDDLQNVQFAFFPLHLEPEISLLTYSKPFMNQIEAIRWFALSLPVGWKLVIKDHPKDPFYRKFGYFKKIFEIPNTLMIDPNASTFDIIKMAKVIFIISGFVGLEALCNGKPVIALGHTSFELLPASMYRHVDNPETIGHMLMDLLENYNQDNRALEKYIASVVCESVRFDWYSIGKNLRDMKKIPASWYNKNNEYSEQFNSLANYLKRRIIK